VIDTEKSSGNEFPPVQVKQQQSWPPILGHYIEGMTWSIM